MKIAQTDIAMQAESMQVKEQWSRVSIEAWVDGQGRDGSGEASLAGVDRLTLSQAAVARWHASSAPAVDSEPMREEGAALDPKLEVMRRTLELLTGRAIKLSAFDGQATETGDFSHSAAGQGTGEAIEQQGWGFLYHAENYESETQALSMHVNGTVMTEGGGEIELAFSSTMYSHYERYDSLTLRAGDARFVDPLVVSLDGAGASFSGTLEFDLDLDGRLEAMPLPGQGGGFLAWDRNGDGTINNGGELFGPTSGNGFSELAAHDSDGNGWLDENDPLFAKLALWMQDAVGGMELRSLAASGIGALLLTPIDTPFALTDDQHLALGRVRESSIALLERGGAALVQEIDFMV